jgi:hypothetical protein
MSQADTSTAPLNAPGWPRPRADVEGYGRLPAIWINAAHGETVDYISCRDDSSRAHTEMLCQVCGEPLGGVFVLGQTYNRKATVGSGMHPRCMALTLSFCPHYKSKTDDDVVAYLYEGEGTGYEWDRQDWDTTDEDVYCEARDIVPEATPLTATQVKDLARQNPMGTASS